SRNGKLRLMRGYFATTPDPERGWALAALTSELSFAEAKPSQVRDLAVSRVDPELFGWSLDFVGDLAETVALIWPEPLASPPPNPPPSRGRAFTSPPERTLPLDWGGQGGGDGGPSSEAPSLTEIVSTLSS